MTLHRNHKGANPMRRKPIVLGGAPIVLRGAKRKATTRRKVSGSGAGMRKKTSPSGGATARERISKAPRRTAIKGIRALRNKKR